MSFMIATKIAEAIVYPISLPLSWLEEVTFNYLQQQYLQLLLHLILHFPWSLLRQTELDFLR